MFSKQTFTHMENVSSQVKTIRFDTIGEVERINPDEVKSCLRKTLVLVDSTPQMRLKLVWKTFSKAKKNL